jgi:heme O synthase-like polyprenyltransferase
VARRRQPNDVSELPEGTMQTSSVQNFTALQAIKVLHTLVWAFFAGCIVAIPIFAWQRRFSIVAALIGAVLVEIAVLVLNRWRCPLTDIAARYTQNRQDNFDIYLPSWLARHNKTIFGGLFMCSLLFSFARWRRWI